MKEWIIKTGVIILVGYMLLIGIPTTVFSLDIEVMGRNYGNNPSKLVNEITKEIPATRNNCKELSMVVYRCLRKYQYEDLRLIGVWSKKARGHAFVTLRDRWGKLLVITTIRRDEGWDLVILDMNKKQIEDFCSMWDRNWTHYVEYDTNWTVIKYKAAT